MAFTTKSHRFQEVQLYFLTLFLGLWHVLMLILYLPLTLFKLHGCICELAKEVHHSYKKGNKYSRYLIVFLIISVLLFVAAGIFCLKNSAFMPDLAMYESTGNDGDL